MRLDKNRYTQALCTACLIFALSGCMDDKGSKQQMSQGQSAQAVPVGVAKIERKDISLQKRYPAIIKPYEEVSIVSRVQGVLEKQHFIEGSYVKKGDLLYSIEQDVYQARVEVLKANYNKASNDYDRAKKLYETQSISDKEYDSFVSAYEDAKANLKLATIDLDYTSIKAPISGIVGIKKADVGNYIQTNALLTTITAINPVHIEFSIPKEDAKRFLPQLSKDNISIKVIDSKGKEAVASGKIDFIAPSIDAVTNTLLLRAKLENSDNSFLVGDFTNIILEGLTINNAIAIPEEAIFQTQNGAIIYIVENDIAKPRPVSTDLLTKDGLIVEGPLKEGDSVIINNIAKIRPDSKVVVMEGN